MKTNRLLQIALTACLLCMAITTHAQVTIGSGKEPEKFSALELISNGKTGMRLPHLTTKDRNLMADTYKSDPDKNDLAKGLTIFNTTTNCLEFWNGSKWISSCEGELPCSEAPSVIIVSDPLPGSITTGMQVTLTATVIGRGSIEYKWYKDGIPIPGATSADYTITSVNYSDYYSLEVSNECGTTATGWAPCGAKTAAGGWLTFMCHNLGADRSLNPFVWENDGDDLDNDIKGYLYQWGRQTDGHEKRTSPTTTTLATNDQASTPADVVGKFITPLSGPDWRDGGGEHTLWGDGSDNATMPKGKNDPCPLGWKVPSQKQWCSIFSEGATVESLGAATANTWEWMGTGPATDGGVKIGDVLYLPTAGVRLTTSGLVPFVGAQGYYWCTTTDKTRPYAYYMSITNTQVVFNVGRVRIYGYSVRCIAE